MAFGDGAGLIDADEEEGDALGAGALQGGKPVRHLLDRGAKKIGQPFQIVPRL